MGEFAWSAKYSIDNAQIDAEHQRLIELANDVATFAGSGEKLPRIKGAIIALYDYVKTHFQHEEEYMLQLGYLQYEEHKKLHEGIIAEMNAIMKHSGNLDTLVYKFKRLMNAWVLEHILTEDSRIAPAKKPEETTDQKPSEANGTAVKTE
ncbi:MAG: hemerythrin family protein [Deltaproteobacteria bacterium]|nr:hemerythrin family protein [Deltaproteobacteria bacterium]